MYVSANGHTAIAKLLLEAMAPISRILVSPLSRRIQTYQYNCICNVGRDKVLIVIL